MDKLGNEQEMINHQDKICSKKLTIYQKYMIIRVKDILEKKLLNTSFQKLRIS